jgi:vacuolar-type H+-ATPase subunit D/Vma8
MKTSISEDESRLSQLKIQYKKLLSGYRSLQQKCELLQAEKDQVIEQAKCSVRNARQETANARARANRFKNKIKEFQSQNN